MKYVEFHKQLSLFTVFSLNDIKKLFPKFDSKRLVEWQNKGYLIKLINKWYLFTDISITEHLLFRISNCLNRPSYISLESALSYYQLIPEAVYSHQAISTQKTLSYKTIVGTFNYRTLKPAFYFGYTIKIMEGLPVLIAEIEKALLDYLYLNANIKTKEDLLVLRLNIDELQSILNWEKLLKYAKAFDSAVLNKRIKLLKRIIYNAHAESN